MIMLLQKLQTLQQQTGPLEIGQGFAPPGFLCLWHRSCTEPGLISWISDRQASARPEMGLGHTLWMVMVSIHTIMSITCQPHDQIAGK